MRVGLAPEWFMYFKDSVFSVGREHHCRCSKEWAEQESEPENEEWKKIKKEKKNTRKGEEK